MVYPDYLGGEGGGYEGQGRGGVIQVKENNEAEAIP